MYVLSIVILPLYTSPLHLFTFGHTHSRKQLHKKVSKTNTLQQEVVASIVCSIDYDVKIFRNM